VAEKQPGCVCFGSKMFLLSTFSLKLVTFLPVPLTLTSPFPLPTFSFPSRSSTAGANSQSKDTDCQTKKTRKKREKFDSKNCKVYYRSMNRRKAIKLKQLEIQKKRNIKAVQWEQVLPKEKFSLFNPGEKAEIYQHFIKLTDIFPEHAVGIVTGRDKLTIKVSKEEMYEAISFFSKVDEAFARRIFKLGDDSRDWQVLKAQEDIRESGIDRKKIVPILYRPFDIRYTYYTGKSRGFICMPRAEMMRHMLRDNIGLITVRQLLRGEFNHCFVADTIIESHITSSQKGIAYIFPLYKYIFPGEKCKKFTFNQVYPCKSFPRQCNIYSSIFTRLHEIFGVDNLPSSSQIFYYIYAILNSGIYRELYRQQLKSDFPRIPFTSDLRLFMRLSSLGKELAAVHLMRSRELDQAFSTLSFRDYNLVIKPLFKPGAGKAGKIYINSFQYFSNIPKELWEYKICGYQVLKKWLRLRKKQKLTSEEILHYSKICRAIQLTIEYCNEIDVLYSQLEKDL
jgi:predicted helicase